MIKPPSKFDYTDATGGNEEYTNTGVDTKNFIKNVDPFSKNSAVPPPPKKGEIIYCQMCRQPILPEHFHKNIKIAKREFKWQTHYACMMAVDDYLDRITPGLEAERRRFGINGSGLNKEMLQEQARKEQGQLPKPQGRKMIDGPNKNKR